MDVASTKGRQWVARVGFVVLILACMAPLVIRTLRPEPGPSVSIVDTAGRVRVTSRLAMERMPALTRDGVYQNQYGNWRDQGTYTGVLLTDLIGTEGYSAVEIVAEDGYRVTIDRVRVEDPDYPMVLAYRMDGVDVPDWEDGFRIAVLPEDGNVSNEDYDAESAGSFWVKRVSQIILHP